MSVNELIKKYSASEIVDALILNHDLTEDQKTTADQELKDIRSKKKSALSSQQILYARVMQLRFQIEDFLNNEETNGKYSFAYFLEKYIRLNYKTNKDFAEDLNLKETALSLYLNKHRYPNDETIMRLDIHSGNNIPAILWYRLIEIEKLHSLENNLELREEQGKYVRNKLDVK